MIDRWGNWIIVSWQEHELLWVRAAITLPSEARANAFRDIAEMRGASVCSVQRMATAVRKQIAAEAEVEYLATHPVQVFARARPKPTPLPPSQLNQGARMQALRVGRRA